MGDQFPAGLRVLVVDDDRTCLAILKKMLLSCAYNVTTCGMARLALAMLRENKERFDVVLSDVYMPDMDGFKLLELVGLEMDLPVIMMSADGETSLVMKGITHGACDYLLKPIRIKELKNIWQHVIRKKRNILRDVDSCDHDKHKRKSEEGDSTSSKKRRDINDDDDEGDIDESSTLKKPRVVWSVELHQQFVSAVNQLGIDKAVPKRILELMNVQGLTRENVASHLQKYRLYLKRLSVAQHQNMSMEPPFAAVVDSLQTHPIITPSSSQALAALRTAYLRTLCSPPTEPVISRVEPPVFIVRPQDNHQRNLILGDSEQLTQSQIVGSQSNSLAEQMIHQQQQHHVQLQPYKQEQEQQQQQQQQHHIQLQQLSQYGDYKDTSNELGNRHMNEGLINTGFILVTNGVQPVSKGDIQPFQPCVNSTSVVKCEQTDRLSGWEYPQQLNSWQQDVQQTDYAPSYRTMDVTYSSDVLQRPEYFIGNNSFKVKQEHGYDPLVIPSQFAAAAHGQQELAGLQPYKQDPESSYFDSEIGLEGYVSAGNVYVK